MLNNLALLLPAFKSLIFRAGTLRLRLEEVDPNNVVTLAIDDAAGTGVHGASVRMRLIPSDEAPGQGSTDKPNALPTLMLYPGRRRHPLGRQAPTSWLNEMGDGLVAVAT